MRDKRVHAVRSGGTRGRLLILALLVAAIAAISGYLAAGALAYDTLTRIAPDCGGWWDGQTPANLAPRDNGNEEDLPFDGAPYRFTDFEDVAFPSRDPALTIRGWWAKPTVEPDAAVILVHGQGKCRRDPEVLLPAGMLHERGFGVLLIDLRDHGASDVEDGRFSGMEEHEDILGAWDWLRSQGFATDRIGVYALSLSSGAAIIAMGQEPTLAALFLDSAWGDPRQGAAEFAERNDYPGWLVGAAFIVAPILSGDHLDAFNPLTELEERLNGRPLDDVHGTEDATIRVHHAADIAAAAARGGTTVTPWIVEGAGHVDSVFLRTAEYEERLVRFFQSALGPAS